MGIRRRIGATIGSRPDDPRVHPPDESERGFGLFGRAERRCGDELARAGQTLVGIVSIIGMVGDAGHGERMHHLQEQRPDSSDEHRSIGMDSPRDTVRAEEPRISFDGNSEIAHRRLVSGDEAAQVASEFDAESAHKGADRLGRRHDGGRNEDISRLGHDMRIRVYAPDPGVGRQGVRLGG